MEESNFRGSRVLEVGAGLGHFLDKIMDRHVPRSGIAALEFSTTGIETLRRKGYLALQEDIRTADVEPGFDAIFLFQVVEHMDGLDELFRRLSDLLAPRGRVFISVPHGKNADFFKKSGWLLEMPPNHIGLWSRPAFAIIGPRHNLEVREIDLEPFSLRGFVKQDIGSSYLRRTQKAGTLANWARSKRTGRNGKLIGVACAAAMAPLRIPVWIQAAKGGEQMCGSFWVEFRKAVP
jgi:SAM-dependent methyltransferase